MFKLILTNGIDDLSLTFKLRNTDIAQKWFKELSKSHELYEVDRFSNWGNNNIIKELNSVINKINSYENIIDRKVNDDTTQDDLNYLHKFFEDYRGEITEKTEWYDSCPEHIKESVTRFNVLIHMLEANIRTKNKHPTIVVTFKGSERIELSQNDIKNFTYRWTKDTVYINYCLVGKTVLDAYKDKDNITEAIRPQTHYSADFMIKFGPSTNIFVYFLKSILLKIYIIRKKLKIKNLNLGMIPVADIIEPIDLNHLLKFNRVKQVICIK
jgi:hypothetical protein